MYTERDHISPKKLAITLAVMAIGLVVLTLITSAVLGKFLGTGPESLQTGSDAAIEATVAPEPTSSVVVTPAIATSAVATAAAPAPEAEPDPQPQPEAKGVIVIDAGHQKKGDSSKEPIGPGATETKPKVAAGTRGVSTGVPESEVTLAVAKKLRDELKARGFKVVMVRTKQDVNIANSKRAAIANEADADLFIRLHCDGAGSSSTKGLSTLVPGKNEWTGPIVNASGRAGRYVHKAVIAATGARDRGVKARTDLAGFNWSEVPTVLVEMGFMTNSTEDKKLNSSAYQAKLAKGMAQGIASYVENR